MHFFFSAPNEQIILRCAGHNGQTWPICSGRRLIQGSQTWWLSMSFSNQPKKGIPTHTHTYMYIYIHIRPILWMDEIHFAPPRKPWGDDFPAKTNEPFFSHGFKAVRRPPSSAPKPSRAPFVETSRLRLRRRPRPLAPSRLGAPKVKLRHSAQ